MAPVPPRVVAHAGDVVERAHPLHRTPPRWPSMNAKTSAFLRNRTGWLFLKAHAPPAASRAHARASASASARAEDRPRLAALVPSASRRAPLSATATA